MKPQPTAAMIVIGDEILCGRTRDSNAHHLAKALALHGIDLIEIRVVADNEDAIIGAVDALRGRVDHLFTSGGIGPTHDDITADCIARAFGVPIGIHEEARAILADYYAQSGQDLNPARLRMARIPHGARLIPNPISRAPGFSIGNTHVMAGVPSIFQEMLREVLSGIQGGGRRLCHNFRIACPEGELAAPLAQIARDHPETGIGCYPFYQQGLGVTLVLRSHNEQALKRCADAIRTMLAAKRQTGPGSFDCEEDGEACPN